VSSRTAILLAAVGTTSTEGRAVFGHIEAQIRLRFPSCQLAWGFTSASIRERLAQQGISSWSPEETIGRLREQGISRIVLQCLHVLAGQDFDSLANTFGADPEIILGAPLMVAPSDISAVLDALAEDFCPDRACLVVAHGHPLDERVSDMLTKFDDCLAARYPNAALVSLVGQPGLTAVERLQPLLKSSGVRFIPLMLSSGRHLERDVLGSSPSSLTSRLAASSVECRPSLGWNQRILDLFCKRIETALSCLK